MTLRGDLLDVNNNLAIDNRDILLVGGIVSTEKIINLKGLRVPPPALHCSGREQRGAIFGSESWPNLH